MSLTTLGSIKNHLGIDPANTSEDQRLYLFIRGCSAAVRRMAQTKYLGGVIESIGIANAGAAPCKAPGHGLESGDQIQINLSSCQPAANGLQTVTVLDPDTFTVPVSVTVGSTGAAYWQKQFTEIYSGDGTAYLRLRNTPVASIVSLYLDNAAYGGTNTANGYVPFAASTQLIEGTDFMLVRDNASSAVCISGQVQRLNLIWDRSFGRMVGTLTNVPGTGQGNIKVTYLAGFSRVPDEVEIGMNMFIALIRNNRKFGAAVQQESYDYYSYMLAPPRDQAAAIGSVRQLLGLSRRMVF